MKRIFFPIICFGALINAQITDNKKDSIQNIKQVNIIGIAKKKIETDMKLSVTVDEFLASFDNISFIKRGAYAWEPLLNNMSSERSTVTIDGMHVFGACTDKMDPITAYVESNNLSTISVKSGQEGSLHGSTIAGNIDLKRKTTSFSADAKLRGLLQTGFEINSMQFFNLGNLAYSREKFVIDASISHRKADNYKDGNNQEVKHSQFNKFNTSLGFAYKTSPFSSLRVDAIFDMAKNVGYPALPMDLWLSRALITSASYRQLFPDSMVKVWDTKFYFNAIEHYMDDTTRPENLVHMDMPGWSNTFGLNSKINLKKNKFSSETQLNAYQNVSIAEMRMYPQDRKNRTMFAYSWPWITTQYAGISSNNALQISENSEVTFGGSFALNHNHSKYVEFNRIFHPGASQEKTRILPSVHAGYNFSFNRFNISAGLGYGHRAPSVSEGYGYYIYNSFDRYDYIGNPDLKNEISYEANASAGFKSEKVSLQAKANYFLIRNYIVGRILSLGSPMNYQSVGVKGYTSLDHAKLFNVSLNANWDILQHLHWKGTLTYARASDDQGGNLPFIRPLSYLTSLHFMHKQFEIQTSVNGDFEQINYSPFYGEDKTPKYFIWNLSADYHFKIEKLNATIQAGAENLLNQHYSTYADWGNIPRMGRNIFTSFTVKF